MKVKLAEPIIYSLKVAGPVFFLSMQGTQLQAAVSIFNKKSVGDLSAIPFVSLFTNCK